MSSRSSKKTSSRAEERVEVGRVGRAHGLRGEVAVESYSDAPERFSPGAELLATLPATPDRPRPLTVATARPHRGLLLVRFAGVADREAAEELRGALLEVPRESVPEAPEDTWYHFQLLGCRCHDRRGGDLGEVVEVAEDGGGALLVVDSGERRLLVPFVRQIVREVDPESGRIELDLPEGLIEACESRS
jgi:16S rRNA processing protein RimM